MGSLLSWNIDNSSSYQVAEPRHGNKLNAGETDPLTNAIAFGLHYLEEIVKGEANVQEISEWHGLAHPR